MRVQLWSYNYAPEPTGIGPLSATLATGLRGLGHEVRVIAAHPHYPEPRWGTRLLPHRERRGGVEVIRLPLWPGRAGALARIRQELSFTAAAFAAAPFLGGCDAILAISPSFPGLAPAIAAARLRRIPLVLLLQDLLPDGATATGLLQDGVLLRSARRFERFAYRSASRIVVISDSFKENLLSKGVPAKKIERVYNPATRPVRDNGRGRLDPKLILTMGNIGLSQNLAAVTQSIERSGELDDLGARFVIAGDGVAGDDVRRIALRRTTVTGILDAPHLDSLLEKAAVAVVSQRYGGGDFNVPSKLMNFMAEGIPVIASVDSHSEVARLVTRSGAGWVTDSADPAQCARQLASALASPQVCRERGDAGRRFAREHFTPENVARQLSQVLESAVAGR